MATATSTGMWSTSSLTIRTCHTGQNKLYCSLFSFVNGNDNLRNLQVLSKADKYNPPNMLSMDHQPKCSHPNHTAPSVNSPEIHVHFKGLGNALQFGGSVLGNTFHFTRHSSYHWSYCWKITIMRCSWFITQGTPWFELPFHAWAPARYQHGQFYLTL